MPAGRRRSKSELRDETKLLLDMAELWHERGLDLPTRTIFVGSESVDGAGESGVDAKMAERAIKNLHLLARLGDGPIAIILNNVGGDVYHGLAIVDAIKGSGCQVTGYVRGHAMSMGSWIFQSCHRRVIGANATQMIHYGYAGADDHAKTFQRWAREFDRLDRQMESMYLERIREKHPAYELAALRGLLDHNTFLTADASVALGLADAIG